MARPSNAARRDRAAEEAEGLIRDNLVDLTRVALAAALQPAEVTCAHCRKKFKLEGTTGDPALALRLIERIAGKAVEKKDVGVSGELEKLLESLSGGPAPSAPSAAQAAAEAKKKAANRAAIAAELAKAKVEP
jgi:hypothetical protein